MRLDEQEKILNKASDKAVAQVIKERKTSRRNLIKEWFRFAELVSKQIKNTYHRSYMPKKKVKYRGTMMKETLYICFIMKDMI